MKQNSNQKCNQQSDSFVLVEMRAARVLIAGRGGLGEHSAHGGIDGRCTARRQRARVLQHVKHARMPRVGLFGSQRLEEVQLDVRGT